MTTYPLRKPLLNLSRVVRSPRESAVTAALRGGILVAFSSR